MAAQKSTEFTGGSYEEVAKAARAEVLADVPSFNVKDFVDKILKSDYEAIERNFFGFPVAEFIRPGQFDDRVPAQGNPFLRKASHLSSMLSRFNVDGIYKLK